MKFACFDHGGEFRTGCIRGEMLVLLPATFRDVVDIIEGGTEALAIAASASADKAAPCVELATANLLSPIRRFRRDVLCTGWNYWDHFEEGHGRREGQDVPRPNAPTFFGKSPFTVVGPRADIVCDSVVSSQWDYEAELALVIGRQGRNIPATRAWEYVWGYCLANDVSARDLQRRHGGQWLKGKSIDGTMPLGPWITTVDSIDPQDIRLQCLINGEIRQDASTRQMAFPIPTLIEELSFGMTLFPGDVLLTGTPSGVGNARTPQVFLRAGDQMIVRGEGLGELTNMLVAVPVETARGDKLYPA
jgi:2-keto-4-pentenoate hydratase/2-oxohepta-3-ene-1,7-dioic acid hydratase in catechol pathway